MATPKSEKDQAQELSVKELAERLKTPPAELRKWLRSEGMGLGQRGKRYAFTPQQATEVARKYKAAQKQPEAKDAS